MDLNLKPQISIDVISREEKGKVLLLIDREIFVLNKTASILFKLCSLELTVKEIIDKIAEAYKKDAKDICADITNQLETFVTKKIIYFEELSE